MLVYQRQAGGKRETPGPPRERFPVAETLEPSHMHNRLVINSWMGGSGLVGTTLGSPQSGHLNETIGPCPVWQVLFSPFGRPETSGQE